MFITISGYLTDVFVMAVEATAVVPTTKRAVSWCFTLNNYTDDELAQLKVLGESPAIKYMILGKEVGEQGTPHLQCYAQFVSKPSFLTVTTKYLPKRCGNVRPMYAKSNPFACFEYCSKDGDFIEYGTRPEPRGVPGRRKQLLDYQAAIDLAKNGQLDDIDSGLLVRYYRTFHSIRDSAPRTVNDIEGPCGLWVHGPPGTGKSTFVRKQFGESLFIKPLSKWWCKYGGQRAVLLDDVDTQHSQWIGYFLKIWADKFPFPAEVKGSQIGGSEGLIRLEAIIVTSNYTIIELFAKIDTVLCEAIMRRFKMIPMTRVYQNAPHMFDGYDLDPYAQ